MSPAAGRRVVLAAWLAGLLALPALLAPPAAADGRALATVVTEGGGRFAFHVEIADTDASRMRGLMFRQRMARDEGMLFLFERETPQSFWMKNTPLSLDMLFIAADGRVVGLAEQTEPYSTRPIPSGAPALAVLEVLGGTARLLGIRIGDRVEHPALRPR